MIPAEFDYKAPSSVEEALQLLAEAGDDAKVIAGGQSLIPVLRMRLNAPELLVDLGKIEALRSIRDDGDTIVIGSMVTYQQILDDASIAEHLGLLAKATATVADPQIRHRGTLGGALSHADPAGDLGAPVLALGATLVVAGSGGTREVAAGDFFTGLFETAVAEGELLTEIRIPKHTGWGSHYEKFVRVSHQWSIVAVAAAVKAEGGKISEARVGLTNMGRPAAAGLRGGGGARRRRRDRGRRTRGGGVGGRGHQPAQRPQRRRGLPALDPAGADASGRARRRGSVSAWT